MDEMSGFQNWPECDDEKKNSAVLGIGPQLFSSQQISLLILLSLLLWNFLKQRPDNI
jgi:hypothetical protein